MGLRRRSRELALQFLFQNEFDRKTSATDAVRSFAEHFDVEKDVVEYAGQIVDGITRQSAEIDREIQACSAHWKIPRMALVDLNVMRIATFEMKFHSPAVPPHVAINEAVDIAKKYGTTDSGAFVNGILDQVARSLT
ncbi:MAG: transcription antitermination factor NusB [Bdellovibrionaceae bacterium]|nr:transcription antitermination factor NusB [Pseudobdellovibrionaceae bacterium]